jgi:Xaa-Pro aminopeptidase
MAQTTSAPAASERLARLRALMGERGYDAVVVRNNPDLRWLTGAAGVFDDEVAHTAYITAHGAWLHTDSRYHNAFVERLGRDGVWTVDAEPVGHPAWVAARVAATRAAAVAVEGTNTVAFARTLDRALEDAGVAPRLPLLHGELRAMRAVKDAAELELIAAAQAVTDAAFDYMCGRIACGVSERELRADLDHFMLAHGGDGLAFASIVASGPNSANPHSVPGPRTVEPGDFVLMDFGAAVGDYCSDMTRTVVVGEPSAKQREVYDLVRRVHEACAAAIRPGVRCREVHELAVRLIEEAGYGGCFGHGLGHGVGVEIHEGPSLGARSSDVLAPGNVVTVEPGVYLPGFGGVRLEDFGVVTEDGFAPFTRSTHELQVLPVR